MHQEVIEVDSTTQDVTVPKWGKAHHLRGLKFGPVALEFLKAFAIGTTLTEEQFDEWAHHHGMLNVPFGAPKKSDAWCAHLQRRHNLRYSMNKAATHPRMLDAGAQPFRVDTVTPGTLEVRAAHDAIVKQDTPQRVTSLVLTKRKQLAYLLQSADFSQLPPHERALAESIYDDIDMFKDTIEVQAIGLQKKLFKLESKIRKLVDSGQVKPVNHGISGLLEA